MATFAALTVQSGQPTQVAAADTVRVGAGIVSAGAALTIATTGATVLTIGPGVQVGAPTGGDQGAGTINTAGGVFKNGVEYGTQIVQTGFDTATNSVGDGDLGYLTTTANRVQKAIATSLVASRVFGANEGVSGSMTTHGTIESQNVESAITIVAGDLLYLSATEAGKVTNVAPTTENQVLLEVGFARTGNGGAGNDVPMVLRIGIPLLV